MGDEAFVPGLPLKRTSTYTGPPSDFKPSSADSIVASYKEAERSQGVVEGEQAGHKVVKDLQLKDPSTRYTDSAAGAFLLFQIVCLLALGGWGFTSPGAAFDEAAASFRVPSDPSHANGGSPYPSQGSTSETYQASTTAAVWLSLCGMLSSLAAAAAWLFIITCLPRGGTSVKSFIFTVLAAAGAATALALGHTGAFGVILAIVFGLAMAGWYFFRRSQYHMLDAHINVAAASVFKPNLRQVWYVCGVLCLIMVVATVFCLESFSAAYSLEWLSDTRRFQVLAWASLVLLWVLGYLKHVSHFTATSAVLSWWKPPPAQTTTTTARLGAAMDVSGLSRAVSYNSGTAASGAVLIIVGSMFSWNSKAWGLYLSAPGCSSCRNCKNRYFSGRDSSSSRTVAHEDRGVLDKLKDMWYKAYAWQKNAQVAYATPAFVFTVASGTDFDASGKQVVRLVHDKRVEDFAARYATNLGWLTVGSMWGIALLGSMTAVLVSSMASAPHVALHDAYRMIAASAGLLWGLAFGAIATSVIQAAGEAVLFMWLLWPNQLQAEHGDAFYDLVAAYEKHEGVLLQRLKYKQLQGST